MTNDALITMNAFRNGIVVQTIEDDYRKIAEFRSF